jgi:hypothetical protein
VPLQRKLVQENADNILKIKHQEGLINKQAEIIAEMRDQLESNSSHNKKINKYLAEIEEKRLKEEEEAKKGEN